MHARKEGGAIVETMGHDCYVVSSGEGEDLAQFRDAAHFGGAGLHEIHRAGVEQVLELRNRGCVFPCCDGDAAMRTHMRQRGVVFRRPHRLLDPAQVQRAQSLRHVEGFALRPWTVHVEHDVHVLARGLARRAGGGNFDLMQFNVAEAFAQCAFDIFRDQFWLGVTDQAGVTRDFRFAAAKQLVHGQFRDFAGDIPQGDVDAGQAENDRAAATENMQLLLDLLG